MWRIHMLCLWKSFPFKFAFTKCVEQKCEWREKTCTHKRPLGLTRYVKREKWKKASGQYESLCRIVGSYLDTRPPRHFFRLNFKNIHYFCSCDRERSESRHQVLPSRQWPKQNANQRTKSDIYKYKFIFTISFLAHCVKRRCFQSCSRNLSMYLWTAWCDGTPMQKLVTSRWKEENNKYFDDGQQFVFCEMERFRLCIAVRCCARKLKWTKTKYNEIKINQHFN